MPLGGLITGITDTLGLTDSKAGQRAANAANAYQQQVLDRLDRVELPDIDEMMIELEGLVSQGIISPEDIPTYLQQASAMNGISTDPRMREAQFDALASLQDISDQGGFTGIDRANLGRIATEEGTRSRGARDAILQNMEARGMGGSGASLLAQLQNAQDSASREYQRDLDVSAMAQQRALESLMQAGQMGGQMQAQDFNQQAQIAQQNDAISRFNAQNQQNVAAQNVGTRNLAQAQNLQERQRIADANMGTRNQQQQYNKGLPQQQFSNAMAKAGAAGGALSQMGSNVMSGQMGDSANKQNLMGGLLNVGGLLGAAAIKSGKDDDKSKLLGGG